ncbi:translation initiation factor IF-2-like [Panicum virgatum]|nr:translation initiation factor IF-2-like [Panicum virgatum]
MPSSEASSSPSKRGLRGPRPQPLKVTASSRGSSPTAASSSKPASGSKKPVIVYEHTPKVVHARPQEFMTVVQRLTGKPAPATSSSALPPYVPGFSPAAAAEEGGDPLLLTLGQGQAAPPPAPTLPSPMAAGLLLSPGFIFSPNTMQAIQDLSPLF